MTGSPALPRVLVAAPATGQGKTTVATGLMAALRATGLEVSGHKVGPDYIDPGYHALACGRPGRNLDPHLVGEDRVVPLLLHGARGSDVAVVEGVMGLYDGRVGTRGFSSSAHVATLTRTPVVLVLDVSRTSRSAGAVAAGMAAYDPDVEIAGVVLNRVGSPRHAAEVADAMPFPVLGSLPHDDDLATPSRHLGLVTAAERDGSEETVRRLGEQVARHLDLDAVLAVARGASPLVGDPWDPAAEVHRSGTDRPVVAVAGGRAFTFRYAETEELLTAAGCTVVPFDPLRDRTLPRGTRAIYLGGGFPEVHAAELGANQALLADLRAAVTAGVPTVAECAGLLYLAESLDGVPMAGAVPLRAAMSERLTLRYPDAEAVGDSQLTRSGERVTGHEFHRTATEPSGPHDVGSAAWTIDGETTGIAGPTLHASYLHVHWAGHPRLAQRFADAAHAARPWSGSPATPDPLDFHGDAEVGPGLLDLAVNVYPEARPEWLEDALREGLADAAAYPDPTAARAALARHHGRAPTEVLPTAGAAEAFDLLARVRAWRHPVVVHPQFTEPHAALLRAGHPVHVVTCAAEDGFALDPDLVPEETDLVVVGNPTNPTGALHPADTLERLRRPGRLVVVDEAFLDVVPGEPGSLAGRTEPDVVVVRSLTKTWSMPGIRAGHLLGPAILVDQLARLQVPWSVSSPALSAMVACSTEDARVETARRARTLVDWREELVAGLTRQGYAVVPSAAPFVLVRCPPGTHAALRGRDVAVRRADTFPGLGPDWIRVAVRPPALTHRFLDTLQELS